MLDGLQILRVALNILNKQSRIADKRCPFSSGVGRGTNNSSPQKHSLLRIVTQGLSIDGSSWTR